VVLLHDGRVLRGAQEGTDLFFGQEGTDLFSASIVRIFGWLAYEVQTNLSLTHSAGGGRCQGRRDWCCQRIRITLFNAATTDKWFSPQVVITSGISQRWRS
jgi:hypothetical protein